MKPSGMHSKWPVGCVASCFVWQQPCEHLQAFSVGVGCMRVQGQADSTHCRIDLVASPAPCTAEGVSATVHDSMYACNTAFNCPGGMHCLFCRSFDGEQT